MQDIANALLDNPVVAAIRDVNDIDDAIDSGVNVIFLLCGSILNIKELIKKIKSKNKFVCVHIDFVAGLGRDSEGVQFLKEAGVDGIITTKPSLVKDIKCHNIFSIQRLFMLDSRSLKTGIKSVADEYPDAIEIMPGIASKVIARIKERVNIPIIAGGLIVEKSDIIDALNGGALAVSTSEKNLWNM